MSYRQKLEKRIANTGSNLCVGLDPRADLIQGSVRDFVKEVIAETSEFAAAFKPNCAYFEALGWEGVKLLEDLRGMIDPAIPLLLDAKRGDIGETQKYYAKACFEVCQADAVTLNPYLGADTLEPFLAYPDQGIYLLAVTSNPGSKDLQLRSTQPGNLCVFELVQEMTSKSAQMGLVVGLTNASDSVLDRIHDVPLLIPGFGAQGGSMDTLKNSGRKAPLLINVSRGILFAEPELSFAQKAKRYAEEIAAALGNQ